MTLKNKEFLEFELTNKVLSNATITHLEIDFSNGCFHIMIKFELHNNRSYSTVLFKLQDVNHISINQSIESIQQQIHNYKLFEASNRFYLSLDPDESSEDILETDQDVFHFGDILATFS